MIIRKNISKEEIGNFPKVAFSGKIHLVRTPQEAERAIAYLKQFSLLGIDTETRPSFKKGLVNKVALVQISTENEAFLFRVNQTGLTLPLITLLENSQIAKVGLSLKDDVHSLHRKHSFEPNGFLDLQGYVKELGIEAQSLQKIYALLFKKKISKSQRLTNWEADVLTDRQKGYAATDAWACIRIYKYLEELKQKHQVRIVKVDI